MTKTCGYCSVEKPIEAFVRCKTNKDGVWNYCKACCAEKQRQQRAKCRVQNAGVDPYAQEGLKKCSDCKRELPRSQFHREAVRSDGLSHICRGCNTKRKRDLVSRRKAVYEPVTEGFKRCFRCRETKPFDAFSALKASKDGLRGECKTCGAVEYQKLRWEVLCHYSGGEPRCACCGQSRPEFLSIDHVNGGGSKHRQSSNLPIYKLLKKEGLPIGMQVLCHNCNQARGYHGYCPCGRAKEQATTQ